MDAVFFSVKRAFHATLRCGRPLLASVGLTPARFDVLIALTMSPNDGRGPITKTQAWLRGVLGVARATICEMLAELERLGWVERHRDTDDRRTLRVELTRSGRELVDRAYQHAVGTGRVPLAVDSALGRGSFDDAPAFQARDGFEAITRSLRRYFGDTAIDELYPWHPDEYLSALLDIEDGSHDILSLAPPYEPIAEVELLDGP